MITAIVRIELKKPMPPDRFMEVFRPTIPKYQSAAGLLRKYYIRSDEGTIGGTYLWETKEAAEQFYSNSWKESIAERLGVEPIVEYLDTPIVVDNVSNEVIDDQS